MPVSFLALALVGWTHRSASLHPPDPGWQRRANSLGNQDEHRVNEKGCEFRADFYVPLVYVHLDFFLEV
jgi:hypothetical protein